MVLFLVQLTSLELLGLTLTVGAHEETILNTFDYIAEVASA